MSKTPVVTSGDVSVKVASHLSKVPLIATDASTSNLIELSAGVILKTGTPSAACVRSMDKNKMHSKRQEMVSDMLAVRDSPTGLLETKAGHMFFPESKGAILQHTGISPKLFQPYSYSSSPLSKFAVCARAETAQRSAARRYTFAFLNEEHLWVGHYG